MKTFMYRYIVNFNGCRLHYQYGIIWTTIWISWNQLMDTCNNKNGTCLCWENHSSRSHLWTQGGNSRPLMKTFNWFQSLVVNYSFTNLDLKTFRSHIMDFNGCKLGYKQTIIWTTTWICWNQLMEACNNKNEICLLKGTI